MAGSSAGSWASPGTVQGWGRKAFAVRDSRKVAWWEQSFPMGEDENVRTAGGLCRLRGLCPEQMAVWGGCRQPKGAGNTGQ